MTLEKLLSEATQEELNGLAKILEVDRPEATPEKLRDKILLCDSFFGYLFTDETKIYSKIVRKAAEKLEVENVSFYSVKELEVKIGQKIFEKMWDKMDPEQRREMERKMKKVAKEHGKNNALFLNAGVFSALTAANLSGFGVYLLASTSLGAITGAMGITLPFATYTAMSSAIATIIGPVGWIGAGIFALFTLDNLDYERLIPAIIYIAMLRHKRNSKSNQLKEDLING